MLLSHQDRPPPLNGAAVQFAGGQQPPGQLWRMRQLLRQLPWRCWALKQCLLRLRLRMVPRGLLRLRCL